MRVCWALPIAALIPVCVLVCCYALGVSIAAVMAAVFKARTWAWSLKWDSSVCLSHPAQRSPPPFPSPWIAFRRHQHLAGAKHARKATHIKRDSWLPVQLLSGFGTVPLQKILRKRRKRLCEKHTPSPSRWLPHCPCFPCEPSTAGITTGLF